MLHLKPACVTRDLLILGFFTLIYYLVSPRGVAQAPSHSSSEIARIYIYNRIPSDDRGLARFAAEDKAAAYLNGELLAEINSPGSYLIYEVEAPFPMSLSFGYQQLYSDLDLRHCANPRDINSCFQPPKMRVWRPLLLQVEAGKEYYVMYTPGGARFSIILMRSKRGANDLAGLRLAGQKHIAFPTVVEAISTIESELGHARGSDRPSCIEQQPLQEVTVTEDGFQFTEVGKAYEGFRKREYTVPVSVHFKGMPYLRIQEDLDPVNSLSLRPADFGTKPGFYAIPCVEKLTTANPPSFADAVNRLIWNASGGGDQFDGDTAESNREQPEGAPSAATAAEGVENPVAMDNKSPLTGAPNVTLDVAVILELTHQFIPNLKPSNFRVYEDGVELKIRDFEDMGSHYKLVCDAPNSQQSAAHNKLSVVLVDHVGQPILMRDQNKMPLKYDIITREDNRAQQEVE